MAQVNHLLGPGGMYNVHCTWRKEAHTLQDRMDVAWRFMILTWNGMQVKYTSTTSLESWRACYGFSWVKPQTRLLVKHWDVSQQKTHATAVPVWTLHQNQPFGLGTSACLVSSGYLYVMAQVPCFISARCVHFWAVAGWMQGVGVKSDFCNVGIMKHNGWFS